jgi:tetratricopeptide (TPR) repeat protein
MADRSTFRRTVVGASLAASLVWSGVGCYLFRSDKVEGLDYGVSRLRTEEIARKAEEADRLFAKPRSPDRVEGSYEAAMASISPANGYRGLWQAARAADWLAANLQDKARREHFARQGVAAAREATRLAPDRVESWYYLAQNLGQLSDLRQTPRLVPEMAQAAERARAIDPKFDRAGPDRFLGLLNLETEGNPIVGYGDFDKAVEHFRSAVNLFPDDAENRVAYARALVKDEDYEEARKQLDAALASKPPPGLEEEHGRWLNEARELRAKIEKK